jgi:hypothetical protein
MNDGHIILGIHVSDRLKNAVEVQKVFTEYGCNIKTRIGCTTWRERVLAQRRRAHRVLRHAGARRWRPSWRRRGVRSRRWCSAPGPARAATTSR